MNSARLKDALRMACDWLVNVAQVKTRQVEQIPIAPGLPPYPYDNWCGAMRNEYVAARRQWFFFGTVWHTGQAVKALTMAAKALDDNSLLAAADLSADFIVNQQVRDPQDPMYGYIWAYEDSNPSLTAPLVNTSAIMECLDGLMYRAEAGRPELWEAVDLALRRLADTCYIQNEGLFREQYYKPERRFLPAAGHIRTKDGAPGRPLIEDAVFLKGYRHTKKQIYRRIFFETAERLLRDEDPPGNWINYSPCQAEHDRLHPRHAFWWGRPLALAYEASNDRRFLDCALRSADFCARALRKDGGIIRGTYRDFNTDSFGLATSGSACAALLFMECRRVAGTRIYDEAIECALEFCRSMQLAKAADDQLQGCILEKVAAPDGTDASPYHNRDIASSFFVQAASLYLMQSAS